MGREKQCPLRMTEIKNKNNIWRQSLTFYKFTKDDRSMGEIWLISEGTSRLKALYSFQQSKNNTLLLLSSSKGNFTLMNFSPTRKNEQSLRLKSGVDENWSLRRSINGATFHVLSNNEVVKQSQSATVVLWCYWWFSHFDEALKYHS